MNTFRTGCAAVVAAASVMGMKLSRRAYRFVIVTHVTASVAWLGLTLSLLVLGLSTLTASDAAVQYASGTAAALLAGTIAVPIGALALVSGVVLMLGTRWSLRYTWVAVKLVATLATFSLTLFLLRPELASVAATLDPDRLVDVDRNVIMGPIVSSLVYLVLTALSYVKPWGAVGQERRKRPSRARVLGR